MPPQEEHTELKRLIEQNAELIKQNNELLRKMHRNTVIGFWMRIVWYGILIGLPFAMYFYLLEPYFAAFGSSFDVFKTGLNELPGLKGIESLMNSIGGE